MGYFPNNQHKPKFSAVFEIQINKRYFKVGSNLNFYDAHF